MPKGLIKPSNVAAQYKWDLGYITEFAAQMFEDANDHEMAYALWALAAGDVGLACEFLKLSAAVDKAGELTPELREKMNRLMDRSKGLAYESPDLGRPPED
jgi:hypothetical protein